MAARASSIRVMSNCAWVSAMTSFPVKTVCNARPSCPPAPTINTFIPIPLQSGRRGEHGTNGNNGTDGRSRDFSVCSVISVRSVFSTIFKPGQNVHQLSQRLRHDVFLRQDRRVNLFEGPVDLQVGVIPLHADLALRVVKVGAFVLNLRDLGGHAKAVSESGRYVDLPEVVSRQPNADPLPEVGRAAADVDRDVVDLPFDDANQFALRAPNLRVKPTNRTAL